jgi:predicted DNA-binding protein
LQRSIKPRRLDLTTFYIKEAIELYLEPVEDDLSSIPGAEVIEIAI